MITECALNFDIRLSFNFFIMIPPVDDRPMRLYTDNIIQSSTVFLFYDSMSLLPEFH